MKNLPSRAGAAGRRIALPESRRAFLRMSGFAAGALLLSPMGTSSGAGAAMERSQSGVQASEARLAD